MTAVSMPGMPDETLIIPLVGQISNPIFNPEPNDIGGKKSHWVFMVARRETMSTDPQPQREEQVIMELWDSCAGSTKSKYQGAKQLAEHSGWLASRTFPEEGRACPVHQKITVPESGRTDHVTPQQGSAALCGLYTILNGWCYLLGIPIVKAHDRRPRCGTRDDFEAQAMELVDNAISDNVRLRAIQAFFNRFGYSTAAYAASNAQVPDIATLSLFHQNQVLDQAADDRYVHEVSNST